MIGRIGTALALASVAALVLVGCTPEEPSEDDVVVEISGTIDGFFQTVDEQHAAGAASAAALSQYATDSLAETWATDIQQLLDSGISSRGVPVLTAVEVTSDASDEVEALVCTDQSDIQTVLADGSTAEPQRLVAWEARLVRTDRASELLLDEFNPTTTGSCGA